MSRIGNKPVPIPKSVKVEQAGRSIKVSGPKGALQIDCLVGIEVKVEGELKRILVSNTQPNVRHQKALHGTMRSLRNNMVVGVSRGFERKMQIFGTGYNVKEQGGNLGFG